MNNLTIEANPSNLPAEKGSETVDRIEDHSVELRAKPAFIKINIASSAETFEQARNAFFSK
jgi:hypothetical protein